MSVRGIIFDLYGTLIDIETDEEREEIYRGISDLLVCHGVFINHAEVHTRYWELLERQINESCEEYPEIDVVAIWESFLHTTGMFETADRRNLAVTLAQLFRKISRHRLILFPEVMNVLNALKPMFRLALVSDAQPCFAFPEIEALGLGNCFDPVVISASYGFRKPDSRLFAKALEQMDLAPDEAVYIGNDMFRDIFGAQQCGLKAVYIESTQGASAHAGVKPDFVAGRFAEIMDLPFITKKKSDQKT
ncbi:MAG: HAD family hydrolase [Erysipelotrichia bacterium]|nr:HAD family hydrolase [Erysipelotrichia bacterium]